MFTDFPEAVLRVHRTGVREPCDFDVFWSDQMRAARAVSSPVEAVEVSTGLTSIRTWDVRFSGWNGQRIAGWFRTPAGSSGPLPVVVEYVGYGGGRGSPLENLVFAAAGYAHLVMDTRGQGAGWSAGVTPDEAGTGPESPGVMTRGLSSVERYYYVRLFVDAVLAVDAVRALPGVDQSRVSVMGNSQGGACALAAGAFGDGVGAVVARVPFLCDVPRAITITDSRPFAELVQYLAIHRDQVEHVLKVLSYVDGALMARRISVPLLVTAALMDDIVPPSGPYAAFNAAPAAVKEIVVHPFNGHEGGGSDDVAASLRFITAAMV